MTPRNKRINGFNREVYDIYRNNNFVATVEVNDKVPGGLKVLLGAMQLYGKELAMASIIEAEYLSYH